MKRSLYSQYRKLGCLCSLEGKLCSRRDNCSAVNYENVNCTDYLGNFSCISLHHWKPARIPCFSLSILVSYKLVKVDRVVQWLYLLKNRLLYSCGKHRIVVSKLKKVNQSHYRPEVPRGFQEVKVPRLRGNDPRWW